MKDTFNEVYYDVERAIDFAFDHKFVLNFYDYLKIREEKKSDVEEFLNSTTANSIRKQIEDLDEYLKGGQDDLHKQLREAYGHLSKPYARKIRDYLNEILEDAVRYTNVKRTRKKTK
jgi:hypothetical protein